MGVWTDALRDYIQELREQGKLPDMATGHWPETPYDPDSDAWFVKLSKLAQEERAAEFPTDVAAATSRAQKHRANQYVQGVLRRAHGRAARQLRARALRLRIAVMDRGLS